MKLKTGIAVLSANAVLVLLIGQAVRGEAPVPGPPPMPLVEASVTVPVTGDPVVVEGALSSNTRGWAQASGATVAREKGVRSEVVDAYSLAVAASPVDCHLTVSLLAAIGQVESGNLVGHGLDSQHRAVPAILGPVLDGKKFAAIKDTDDGLLDGDKVWDRAVGPMQFVPASWRVAGVDMDGDGRRDPQDVDDAAGTAMVYLCAGGRDLATDEGLRDAVLSYNHSAEYLRTVLGWKSVFDRNPLTGWAALPLLDAWELTPDIPAVLPTPTAVRESRTTAPALNAGAAPEAVVTGTSPAKPASPVTSLVPANPTTGATTTPRPTAPAATPSTPAPSTPAPSTSVPGTKPDPEPKPSEEPLPPCPVPTPGDPSATPTAAPNGTTGETAGETTGETTGDDGTTSTADIPGDGTDEPVECLLPVDPVTGQPITPAPGTDGSTAPETGNAG